MTNQLQGEILFGGWEGAAADEWAYTPWMPVRGDLATFGVEVTFVSGITLTWDVETRTTEDPASVVSTILSAPQTINSVATGVAVNSTNAKQLVRYKFKTGNASTANFVVFRALQPSWQANR